MTILAWVSLVINVFIALVTLGSNDMESDARIFSLAIQFPTLLFIVLYLIN
ncbi:hypothetical protein [Bacillus sp. XF8]|uniref:hypothetical protein n=1 Tax=Bacillus sp. XF8 TaxID=2819289 RepID=UPI001AA09E7C|nr:hypothetical protein [Bacillus sp. XF8]MBO1582692.1 hypothetical protein [Bacillus sp. XF8]